MPKLSDQEYWVFQTARPCAGALSAHSFDGTHSGCQVLAQHAGAQKCLTEEGREAEALVRAPVSPLEAGNMLMCLALLCGCPRCHQHREENAGKMVRLLVGAQHTPDTA